jgi:hypothetical protein
VAVKRGAARGSVGQQPTAQRSGAPWPAAPPTPPPLPPPHPPPHPSKHTHPAQHPARTWPSIAHAPRST